MQPTNFIVNPKVIGLNKSRLFNRIKELAATCPGSEVFSTELDPAGRVIVSGYRLDLKPVVVCGGDGTISTTFDYLERAYRADSSPAPEKLAIACGTGNGINVALGIKKSPLQLIELYAQDRLVRKEMDLIELQDKAKSRYVINLFDAGLVPEVLQQRNEMLLRNPEFFKTHSRVYRHEIAYVLASLMVVAKAQEYGFSRLEFDQKPQPIDNVKLLTLGNGLSYSSKPAVYPLPTALIDDGKISAALHRIPSAWIPKGFVSFVTGVSMLMRMRNPYAVRYCEAEEVLIEGEQIPCQIDGEYIGRQDSLELRICKASEKKGTRVLVPA
jgi:diacylglycerol kinase family enzyme